MRLSFSGYRADLRVHVRVHAWWHLCVCASCACACVAINACMHAHLHACVCVYACGNCARASSHARTNTHTHMHLDYVYADATSPISTEADHHGHHGFLLLLSSEQCGVSFDQACRHVRTPYPAHTFIMNFVAPCLLLRHHRATVPACSELAVKPRCSKTTGLLHCSFALCCSCCVAQRT